MRVIFKEGFYWKGHRFEKGRDPQTVPNELCGVNKHGKPLLPSSAEVVEPPPETWYRERCDAAIRAMMGEDPTRTKVDLWESPSGWPLKKAIQQRAGCPISEDMRQERMIALLRAPREDHPVIEDDVRTAILELEARRDDGEEGLFTKLGVPMTNKISEQLGRRTDAVDADIRDLVWKRILKERDATPLPA